MYTPRTLEAYLKKADRQVPVLLVTGARQVGKLIFRGTRASASLKRYPQR